MKGGKTNFRLTQFLFPDNLSRALKTLLDSQLVVKLESNNGDRIRLWDDASPQEQETLRTRLVEQNFSNHDDFLLDLILLIETLAPQTHFYDIFSVQKRETAPHVRRLVPLALKRASEPDCAPGLKEHIETSLDFGVFVTSNIVLSSVDSVWNKLPLPEVQLMEAHIQHCETIIKRANEQQSTCHFSHNPPECVNQKNSWSRFLCRFIGFKTSKIPFGCRNCLEASNHRQIR